MRSAISKDDVPTLIGAMRNMASNRQALILLLVSPNHDIIITNIPLILTKHVILNRQAREFSRR